METVEWHLEEEIYDILVDLPKHETYPKALVHIMEVIAKHCVIEENQELPPIDDWMIGFDVQEYQDRVLKAGFKKTRKLKCQSG